MSATVAFALLTTPSWAAITSFNEWTLVEDPADPNFSATVDSSSKVTLSATGGPIASTVDIGYQSINGSNAANSTSGYAFDPIADFSVAVDFDLSLVSPVGGFSIGFGIGEDKDGVDSAGVVLATDSVFGSTFVVAARVDDVPAGGAIGGGSSTGRFIVSYEAATGDIDLGVSTDDDDTPEVTGAFLGKQNEWNDQPLLVSLFARGGNGVNGWTSGTAEAVFTDMRVLSGSAMTIPEPSSAALFGAGVFLLCIRRVRD